MFVSTTLVVVKPAVPPVVSYRDMREGQPFRMKLSRQCNRRGEHGGSNRERRACLLARRRAGTRMDGMVNIRELLINVVNWSKLNVLLSLDQKVHSGHRN